MVCEVIWIAGAGDFAMGCYNDGRGFWYQLAHGHSLGTLFALSLGIVRVSCSGSHTSDACPARVPTDPRDCEIPPTSYRIISPFKVTIEI